MMSPWKAAVFCGSAILALSTGAPAQNPARSPASQALLPVTSQPPLYDPQQLPVHKGQVQQFTLTPRGDIDGLILTDGTEVKTPPHLSTEIAYSMKPGDPVTIHGLHAAALPLIQAVSITDEANGRTVIDNGPPGPRRGPGVPPAPVLGSGGQAAGPAAPIPGQLEAQGRVRMTLHGPRGEVNGALLDDGTILRLPPPEAYRFAALLQPGQLLNAEGIGITNAIGRVIEVQELGSSRDQMNLVPTPYFAPAPPPRS